MTITLTKAEMAQKIADDLVSQLDEFHSLPEVWDNELDRQIHEWYANAPKKPFPKRPYFSPSASDACPRELYYKAKKAPKDGFRRQPHQARWAGIGTRVGDLVQRDILAMERNLEDKAGISPKFRFERTADGFPMFEEFAGKNHRVNFAGRSFYLYGFPDGIMTYRADNGEKIRVGLEVKTKQTTPARTSDYSMRGPQEDHVKQVTCYAEMYDVDYYVILYVNTAHKSWSMTKEEYEKNPDIRAFGIHVGNGLKADVFSHFVDVLDAVEANEPPPLNLDKWSFNGFKQAIVADLTREEMDDLRIQAERISNSSLPEYQKRSIAESFESIEKLWEAV